MATIAELETRIIANNTQFKAKMSESASAAQGFSNKAKLGLAAVAALVTGALIGAFHALVATLSSSEERLSKLVDTATRLGAGIPELQRLQYAAQQSGLSIDSLNGALGKMLKNLGNAAREGDKADDAFSRIGLSAAALSAMGVDQQYLAISEAIKKIQSPAEQAAAAVAIFGKSGIEQLSLLKDNVSGLLTEFKGLGIELTTAQASSVEQYGDSVSKLGAVWEGFQNQLTAALAGPLKSLLDWIIETSINMGGLAPVATAAAQGIVAGMQGVLLVMQVIKNVVDLVVIAFDALAATALQSVRIATLGLADLLTNAASTQAAIEADAIQRIKNIGGSSATLGAQTALSDAAANMRSPAAPNDRNQQARDVRVQIELSDGLLAKYANSDTNKAVITNTVNNSLNQAVREGQR